MVRPLYDARYRDIGSRDIVVVRCAACSHSVRIGQRYLARLNLEPYQPILSLKWRLRCRRCHTRGHVDISIEWHG
jgi:hypothetical protein